MLLTRLVMTLLLTVKAVPVHATLVDRQLLEIEASSYSQRQFEIYFFVKQLLLSRSAKPGLALNQANWSEEILRFKNEMLINQFMDQEAQRLSSLFPNRSMLETSFEMLQNRAAQLDEAKEQIKRLQASDDELRRALTQLLKVQTYLKSRVRLLDASSASENWGYKLDETATWFARIEQNFRYRFYEGAMQYQVIRWQ